jgi:hypothetical protein
MFGQSYGDDDGNAMMYCIMISLWDIVDKQVSIEKLK